MTPVGHTFTGLALGVLLLPPPLRSRQGLIRLAALGVIANLPDLPVKGWGHDEYAISHSIFVNLGLAVVAVCLLSFARAVNLRVSWRFVLIALCAWMSHFLLDTFYAHGKGIGLFWPLSNAKVSLPIPIFETLGKYPRAIGWHMARVFAIEFVAYGMLLVLVCLWRWARERGALLGSRTRFAVLDE